MGLFKKNSAKEIKTTLSMIDGLPDISAGAEMVLSLSGDILSVRPRLVQRIINNCYIKPMPLPLH